MNKLGSHFVKDQLFSFHVLMPLIMLVSLGLVYLPFGFSQVGLIEEWGALGFFTEYGPLYFVTKYSHMAQTRMRPLHMLPQSIGYRLDTDSFFYWHLLQFLFIWLKGVAMGSILWWLYSQRGIAILGALLLMLYPADTMQLAIRSININGAVTSAICAVACLLWATEVKNLWARAILASFAGVLFFCASLLYEAAFFLAPTPLILWWAKYGMHDGWRALKTQKLVLCCWLASILMELGYLYWLSFELDPYTSHLNNTPWNTLKIIFQNSPMLLKVGFYRTFLHSWYDAGRMLLSGGKWVAFLPIAVPSILLLVLYLSAKNADLGKKISRKDPGFLTRWFVASILITALGYAPYLALVTHHRITQRTYLFAAIGGALLCTALIAAFRERFRWLGAGIAGCLVLLGLSAQWTQFAHYEAVSDQQKEILSGILESAPRLESKQTLLILDRTGRLGSTWMLRGELLNSALTYLYGKKVESVVCLEPGLLWNSFNLGKFNHMGRCEEQQHAWQIGQEMPGAFSLPKEQLVTLIIERDGRVHSDTTSAMISPSTPSEQARWTKVLGCWPAEACRTEAKKNPLPDHFRFDFGKWWSMDEPIPGAGWVDSTWIVPALQPRSFAWINEPQSTLLFRIAPRSEPYLMQLGLAQVMSESTKMSLKAFLNGHPLPYKWLDDMHAEGKIDPTWLKEGINELLFLTDMDPNHVFSLGVEYVNVVPQKGVISK